MAKLNDIRALAESHAAEIARSVQAWTGYLDTAATLYRYDFPETLLIHAQRPDATACAEMEIWNNRMGRWVNRGSKGIALIDDSGPRKSLRYVFDISDTHMVRGGKTPYIWQMESWVRPEMSDYLADTYGLETDPEAPFQPCSCPWQGHRQRKISMMLWMASHMRFRERGWKNLAKMPSVKVSAGSWKTAPITCWHDAVVLIRGRNSPLMTSRGSRTSTGFRPCPFWAMPPTTLQSLCSGISAGS